MTSSFPDGTSNTILATEKMSLCGSAGTHWSPVSLDYWQPVVAVWSYQTFQVSVANVATCDPTLASTPFNNLNVALADGSVRSLRASLNRTQWWALCTPDKGEVVTLD